MHFTQPQSQSGFEAVRQLLDEAFQAPTPVSAVRVGLLFDYSRSGQLVLLATEGDRPIGAALALRGLGHANMTHIAVEAAHRGQSIGRALFNHVTHWALAQGFPEVRWCVAPANDEAVNGYLAWGARFTGWLDNGYGVDADPCNRGETPRFMGCWRPSWPAASQLERLNRPSMALLRDRLQAGASIVSRAGDHWTLAR